MHRLSSCGPSAKNVFVFVKKKTGKKEGGWKGGRAEREKYETDKYNLALVTLYQLLSYMN